MWLIFGFLLNQSKKKKHQKKALSWLCKMCKYIFILLSYLTWFWFQSSVHKCCLELSCKHFLSLSLFFVVNYLNPLSFFMSCHEETVESMFDNFPCD